MIATSTRLYTISLGLVFITLLTLIISAPAQAYCGPGSNTAYWDCDLERANRAGLTAKYSPTTPSDIQYDQNWAKIQQQREQNTLALLGPALQQAEQAGNHGLNVLRAGGDPNTFFAQQSIPNTTNISFQNTLYAGPGSDTNALLYTISNFMSPLNSLLTYTPPFLNDMQNFLYTPTNPGSNVSLKPTLPPGSCSLGNPLEPTTIRFIHAAARPVIAYLLDYQCQDVPFVILFPGTVYDQLTFVGQTWHFYDALTGLPLVGQPEYIIPNKSPQTYTIFDIPGQQPHNYAQAQAAQLNRNEILQQRYNAINQQQLNHYYNDNTLSMLRIEYNQHIIHVLYTDPSYLYLSYERDNISTQVRASQPSYLPLKILNQEISTWKTPPVDDNQLRFRYAKRLQSYKLQIQLESEISTFLASHPQIVNQINSLSQLADQRAALLQHNSDYLLWNADWMYRMQLAYHLSNQGFAETQQLEQLQRDYPDFVEYQRLRREVSNLLPSFDNHPQVRHVANMRKAIFDDQDAHRLMQIYQDSYLDQATAILTSTLIPADLENYYEQINGLLEANIAYNQLRLNYATTIQGLEAYRKQVHDAVAQCKARNPACDPTFDAASLALIKRSETQHLINRSSEFYEHYNRFWYTFYTSDDYVRLETSTKAKLQGVFSTIQPSLQAAQLQFKKNVDSIPSLHMLREASNRLVMSLCSNVKNRTNSTPITDPTTALCVRLDRMSMLEQIMNGAKSLEVARFTGYMPIIMR